MSSTVRGYGIIVKLLNPVPEDQREDVSEKLYEKGLGINYEGTLVYMDLNAKKPMSEREDIYHLHLFGGSNDVLLPSLGELIKALAGTGIEPDLFECRWFNTIWYNGSDSYLDELTLEDFLKS